MSFLSSIIGNAAKEPIEALGSVFDKLFTSDEEKAQAEAVLSKIAQQPHILQAEINQIEAQHRSVFVAGWRPFIGWVCGFGLAWHFIFADLLHFIWPDRALPNLSGTEQLITIVISLLGLGGLRTFEKVKGRTK